MEVPMSVELKTEVLNKLKLLNTVSLATCAGNQPQVRPMTMIFREGRFFTVTGERSDKVRQLAANPKIAVCARFPEGESEAFIRWLGTAETVTDQALKSAIHTEFDYIRFFWPQPDDANHILLEFHFHTADYNRAEEYDSTTFPW
jgi:general stress protein 26